MPALNSIHGRTAKRHDTIARWVITLCGIAVIASVVVIIALIVGVTVPLLQQPTAELAAECHLPNALADNDVLGLGVDANISGERATAFLWTPEGAVLEIDLLSGETRSKQQLPLPDANGKVKLLQVESVGHDKFSLLWSDGSASLVEIATASTATSREERWRDKPRADEAVVSSAESEKLPSTDFPTGSGSYQVRTLAVFPRLEGSQRPRMALVRRSESGSSTMAALLPDAKIVISRQQVVENILGEEETSSHQTTLDDELIADITAMTMDSQGDVLYAGTGAGCLLRWQLDNRGEVKTREVLRAFSDGRSVTALALVLGDFSLAVGDSKGGLSVWFPVSADETRKLRLIHQLQPHATAVRAIVPSGRTKSILSLGQDGSLHLDHVTSERRLLTIVPEQAGMVEQVALGRRGDVLLALDQSGELRQWRIEGGYPEVSLKTLFARVHYEGYDRPEFVWQTTGGEDFEPKFSLTPLIFGTLKGTFYAMIFALPLALFGAVYTSYFTTPGLRRMIKPAVEIMATTPSVVIGFLIALWLAPLLERWLLVFFLSLAAMPATAVVFLVLWQLLRQYDWAKRVENGYEFLVMLPVLAAGVAVAAWLAGPIETWFFGGDFRLWLFEGPLSVKFDQRNSIIIAFGLGFTVIPIIFSIAEDSLSSVPYNMTAASMALGSSRWQTLWRVVLPSASPGIFAAAMIGFGRAVGETMIVLMATGNTPILDISPLNGMRTLSANIAVEIPEAPVGGTLYRVLFLCAVLLFMMTFAVNTAAELVRQRLRKRFGQF